LTEVGFVPAVFVGEQFLRAEPEGVAVKRKVEFFAEALDAASGIESSLPSDAPVRDDPRAFLFCGAFFATGVGNSFAFGARLLRVYLGQEAGFALVALVQQGKHLLRLFRCNDPAVPPVKYVGFVYGVSRACGAQEGKQR